MTKNVKTSPYIFDSYALLAYFQAEAGGEKVRQILTDAAAGQATVLLSVISLGEIYYIVARKKGKEKAMEIMADMNHLPIEIINAETARVLAAADIKAQYPLSYGDAFVAAAAEEFSGTIVTGDPEFSQLQCRMSLLWL